MTDEDWERLYDGFDTHGLLEAVDAVDRLRDRGLSPATEAEAFQIRSDLLKLHRLAMSVVTGSRGDSAEMFKLAADLQDQICDSDLDDDLDSVWDTLSQLLALAPASI